LDNSSSLKGEILMQFYNFTHRHVFEDTNNMPISLFSFESFFDAAKNVFIMKSYHTNLLRSIFVQNKVRNFYFFQFKDNNIQTFSLDKPLGESLNTKNVFFSENLLLKFRGIFQNILTHILNFVFVDFFLFFKSIDLLFSNYFKISVLNIIVVKCLTLLKLCFLFILINLENDAFTSYLNLTLYKLAKSNYYKEEDWLNLKHTYYTYLSNSIAFSGDIKGDRLLLFKSFFAYLFIYLSFSIFLLLSFFVLFFKYLIFFLLGL
jgi:hypothetical protein